MKIHPLLLAVFAFLGAPLLTSSALGAAAELWVAPGGSDTNSGASNAPLASLETAIDKWRSMTALPTSSPEDMLRIRLQSGVFTLSRTVTIQAESDPRAMRLTIEAVPGEHPVLSGAVTVAGWKRMTERIQGLPAGARGKTWVADAPRTGGQILEIRQLWINDSKAIRAREPNAGRLARLTGWNRTNQVATISAASASRLTGSWRQWKAAGKQPIFPGLEMVIDQVWEIAVLRVKSIDVESINASLSFRQPESRLEFEHPWPPVTVNARYRAPFFLANAIEFLDELGEWYEDLTAGKIYYWPRGGEDMTRAKVFAPMLETLLQIEGSPERPVANVQFKGITFAHTTWLRPSTQGHVPLQAGMFLLEAQKLSPKDTPYHPKLDNVAWIGRPPAAVVVRDADHISFENCTFEHLASAGLDFQAGTRDDSIQGCVFRDIGGNGIQLGKFSDTNVETHVPWNPTDERELCQRATISNNVVADCANEDWGCVGIAIGYARNVTVAHNEIFNLPCTGISVGWGWTKTTNALRNNFIYANRVHHVGQMLGDLGGIYLLSAQPGTVIAENFISDISPSSFVPDPDHWFYLYLDEGSSGITVRDNWCPSEKILRNANGPGNVWTNNGPQVSEQFKNNAGLEPAFRHLISP